MRVLVEMLVKMRFGIGAEEDDSSAQYKIKNGCIIEH